MDLRFDKMQAADFNIKIRFVGIYIATVIIAIVIPVSYTHLTLPTNREV